MKRFVLQAVLPPLLAICICQVLAADTTHVAGVRQFVEAHCLDCHDDASETGGLSLESLDASDIDQAPDVWESVVRKLRRREMPPADVSRPDEAAYDAAISALEEELDLAAGEHPRPGRTDTFRRMTRTEYGHAIRDLLALDVDAASLLPADEASHGFDNVTVGDLSPTLLNRYISAAEQVSRLAVGGAGEADSTTIRLKPDITQEEHVEGLPIGTRGGVLISHKFPEDGEYEVQVRLMRDRNEEVEGLKREHELEVLLDRGRMALFTLKPPRTQEEHQTADAHLHARFPVSAGPHDLGVTFLKESSSLLESQRQPYDAHFNFYRHPRLTPAVFQVTIRGPYDSEGPGATPSRERIFVSQPTTPADEDQCAREILNTLLRRAYRRPVTEDDLRGPLQFYHDAREEGRFEAGVEAALSAVLVNPNFLFRIERDPPGVPARTAYRISDIELASRLSFFLWSSIPDDELLDIAAHGELNDPVVLEQQVRRMLADERSQALATNFADQWLYLRNLDSTTPNLRSFPDFDDNLRQAFRQESELFFASILREDRSVLDLIDADYTYLNERLAKHYDVPYVYGSRFRRVELDDDSHRGGLLRQGSILTVTSYATRTSPVIRGKWVLENLLGSPPPPPPGNVPALEDNTVSADLPVRERLAAHRANESCAVCHNQIDPVGFALENFDAVGRWREMEAGKPVDATGGLPDGSEFDGVEGLEQSLLNRPEVFTGTLVEKLLTYALGRGVEPYDAPAVRRILRDAEEDDYRFSSLIMGIARSTPFQMRTSE